MIEEAKENEEGRETEEEPQVYSVEKGLTGWKFDRREFLIAAAAAGAAATVAAMGAIDKSREETSETVDVFGDSNTLAVAMLAMIAVMPAQPFTQIWRITNNSETDWRKEATLHLVTDDQLQAPASVPVPDIAPGETIVVKADMVAPANPGTYQSSWRLQAADDSVPVASGPFVVLNGCLCESSHNPYGSGTWQVTNLDADALGSRVHFSQVDVETDDDIILKDNTDEERQRITGSYPSGLWSEVVPGKIVKVELTGSGNGYGFCLDQVETFCVYMPLILKEPTPTSTPTPTPTPCTCHSVCSCDGHCSCNPHCTCDQVCTCDTIHYWFPN